MGRVSGRAGSDKGKKEGMHMKRRLPHGPGLPWQPGRLCPPRLYWLRPPPRR